MNVIDVAGIPERIKNALSSKSFRAFINQADGDDEEADLLVYDAIGQSWDGKGVDASSVAAFLAEHKSMKINVRINSPGGMAYDGITIHNALVQYDGQVTTTVEGLAASAATIIAVAGGRTGKARMYENGTYFVHRALALAIGNRDDLDETMEWLDRIDEQIARTYAAKTGKRYDAMFSPQNLLPVVPPAFA